MVKLNLQGLSNFSQKALLFSFDWVRKSKCNNMFIEAASGSVLSKSSSKKIQNIRRKTHVNIAKF